MSSGATQNGPTTTDDSLTETAAAPAAAASANGAHATAAPTAGSPLRGGAAVLAALGIMLVAANLRPAVVSVAPLVDVISSDEGFSSAVTGLLTALPVLFFGLAAPLAPRLAARFGIERTVFAAMGVLIVGIAVRIVDSPVALMAGSVLIGAAIGVCNVVLPSLIKRDFAHRSGLMTGLYSMTLSGMAAVAAGLTVPINNGLGGNWHLSLAFWGLLAAVTMVIWLPQLRAMHVVAAVGDSGRVWRDPVAWAITVYMGAQSLIFYTFNAWLPQYLMDHGYSAGTAGTMLAVGGVVGLVSSLVAPIVAGKFADQRIVTAAFLAVCVVGFAGLLLTDAVPAFWACLIFVGPGAGISLALLFMVLRSNSTQQTAQASGMAQSVGYVLAAVGPIMVGAVHDATSSWTAAMGVLALAVIPQGLATLGAARNRKMAV